MRKIFILFLGLLFIQIYVSAQAPKPDLKALAKLFASTGSDIHQKLDDLVEYFIKLDTNIAMQELHELAKSVSSKNYYAQTRLKVLQARVIFVKSSFRDTLYDRPPAILNSKKELILELFKDAIDLAYRSEDDYLIAYVSYQLSTTANALGEKGLAVMYARNAIEIYERLNYPIEPLTYQVFAELMYQVREYRLSMAYAKKSVIGFQATHSPAPSRISSAMNTVALGYHRLKIYDSALLEYDKALQFAKNSGDSVWEGIISGNIAQILYVRGKYDSAYQLLIRDYRISKNASYYDNAANSLQWAARCEFALGGKEAALDKIRECIGLLSLWPDPGYRKNAYFTYAEILRGLGKYDSAFYYTNLHSALNDSLERIVNSSSLSIAKAKLDNEINRYNIQNINKEKRSQIILRNILIIGIIVLAVIAMLFINRKRLRDKLKGEKAEQEKKIIEQEIASAREQLKMFTANIVEKTNLIEKLEEQVAGRQATEEQQSIISELSQQSILTEEHWLKFKGLFEKIYPGFFIKLKEMAPEVTLAEQRMAALIRLQLTTRQMATMLGISSDSVHKTRQRLRQRLQINTGNNLDEAIASIA